MFYAICLAVLSSPPVAPPADASPRALAWTGRFEPLPPREGIRQRLSSGERIWIVPEKPIKGTESYIAGEYSTCGMGCCLAPIVKTRTLIVNGPTPLDQIEAGLGSLDLTSQDVVFDLGCGDGRACILAAARWGCRAVGLDNRPAAVELARRNAEANGVAHLTRFYERDLFRTNLEDATVVFAHLSCDAITRLEGILPRHIRGAVSYDHPWQDGRRAAADKFYVWRSPTRTAGRRADSPAPGG